MRGVTCVRAGLACFKEEYKQLDGVRSHRLPLRQGLAPDRRCGEHGAVLAPVLRKARRAAPRARKRFVCVAQLEGQEPVVANVGVAAPAPWVAQRRRCSSARADAS